jgi:hypothetical protein
MADLKTSQINLRLSPSLKVRAERAAARDHRSLTSLIEKLLSDHLRARMSLESWHHRAHARFDRLALEWGQAALINPKCYRTLSFAIHTASGFELEAFDLLQIVSLLPNEMRGALTSNLFNVYNRQEISPYYTTDSESDEEEILECVLFPIALPTRTAEFWRITPSGLASHIRPYNEDRENFSSGVGHAPGKWFWPYSAIRDLYELVLFALLLSARFQAAESVEFRCEWWGLDNREIADAEPTIHWTPGKIARESHRVTRGEWEIDELRHQPNVVSALLSPVLRLFDPSFDCSPTWVGEQTTRFKWRG